MTRGQRRIEAGLVLAAALMLVEGGALSLAASEPADGEAAHAWQGQGRGRGEEQGRGEGEGRGQGRGEREGRGDRGGGRDDGAPGRSRQGRGNGGGGRDDGAPGRSGQGRGNQGRGNQGRDERGGPPGDRGRGNDHRDEGRRVHRGRPDRPDPAELRAHVDRLPGNLRQLTRSERRSDRVVAFTLARASLRGVAPDRIVVERDGARWLVRNRSRQILLDLDDDRVRDLGAWRMRRLGDRRPSNGSPAFCRSGAGHPVWGRDWCLEKGFGLGVRERSIWSRADVDDVVFRRRPRADLELDRGGLIDVLGDIVFGRLAVQSLVLGHDEPLVGRWVVAADEPDAPWILRVSAGDVAVAEFVDRDRDDDVEVLFVAQPRW